MSKTLRSASQNAFFAHHMPKTPFDTLQSSQSTRQHLPAHRSAREVERVRCLRPRERRPTAKARFTARADSAAFHARGQPLTAEAVLPAATAISAVVAQVRGMASILGCFGYFLGYFWLF